MNKIDIKKAKFGGKRTNVAKKDFSYMSSVKMYFRIRFSNKDKNVEVCI